ncbi:BTAD domain-containing putative transcriptional regulator [Nonomuraea typhae]|uniref:BTAD domain-containing putative transcriptional regulator n=1 Tax=Nonomuraea typhae TaxID=2603600 RepID=A0ABW7Z6P3_9ACTN
MLGSVQAYTEDGAPIDIGGVRLRMLLARLALAPGAVVPAATLIDDLWGDSPPADAANALQALVSRLRRAMDGAAPLESATGGYRLVVAAADVDAERFETLAAQGHRELAEGRPAPAAACLGPALALWRGSALADLPDVPFAASAAARLADRRRSAEEDRCEAEILLGRHLGVLADLKAVVEHDPLRERAAALLMRALHAAGRQAEALAVFERVRLALADELGADPSAELRAAHLLVLQGEGPAPSPVRLPRRLTSFVGREADLATLAELMERHRLVTIVGPGGAGKTRLAVEAMSGRERVWFASLAGVSVPAQADVGRVAEAVLGALSAAGRRRPGDSKVTAPGTADDPGAVADPVERVAELIGPEPAVLVLDNCEHLVPAAAQLASGLLDRLPYLGMIATSREALAITGEALCRLGPLPESEAARLFGDRAAAVRPEFRLDELTTGPVTDICRRLDGLPLALELAAARLRSMSVEQIARRLDDRFRLLTSGDRAAVPRQRTLLAVVEWSWDLLTEQERTLARRLSMFPAGAPAGAAEAVCADDSLPAEDVVYVLGSLVEKSFADSDGAAEPRYRMLETVRAYAAEQLRLAGEHEEVAARFRRHYVEFATAWEPLMLTARQLEVSAAFDADYDNLVFALRAAIDGGDAETAWRLLGPLYLYWNARYDARSDTFVADVLAFGERLPAHVRAAFTAAHLLANNSGSMPPPEVVRPIVEECLRTGALDHYPMMAVIALAPAHLYGFADLWERELPRALVHPHPWVRACAHWLDAFARTDHGDWRGGEIARARALHAFEEVGERYGLSITLMAAARAHSVKGEYGEAVATAERSARLAAELGTEEDVMSLMWLAGERLRGGDPEGAWQDVEEARRRVDGRRYAQIEFLLFVADLHRRAGEPEPAERALDEVTALAGELTLPDEAGAGRAAPTRMAILLDTGRPAAARLLWPRAMAVSLNDRDPAASAQLLARLLLAEGDPEGAAEALGMSEAIRGVFDLGDPELTGLRNRLGRKLGESAYAAAYRRGAALSRDAALQRLTRA